MSPGWLVLTYVTAIVFLLLATLGVDPGKRGIGWGWLGIAVALLVPLVDAVQAL